MTAGRTHCYRVSCLRILQHGADHRKAGKSVVQHRAHPIGLIHCRRSVADQDALLHGLLQKRPVFFARLEGFALSEGEAFYKIPLKDGLHLFGAICDQHVGSRVQKRRIRDKMQLRRMRFKRHGAQVCAQTDGVP